MARDQERRRGQRRLEGLRRALEAAVERDRRLELGLRLLDGRHRLAECRAGREVEGDRHRRELALVVDGERRDLLVNLATVRAAPARRSSR